MTKIVKYFRAFSSRPIGSRDADILDQQIDKPANRSLVFILIHLFLIVFCLSASVSSFAGSLPGISQCIAASEENGQDDKKKPEGGPPTDEQLEEDCD